ncbi:phosphatase PAP2 family protein [Nocardioides sp.]|uniref:phosphatase PAP2 family protein n=1 Tax=Nocardioides sp. TaxID=35761 RepID=UPI0031FE86B7
MSDEVQEVDTAVSAPETSTQEAADLRDLSWLGGIWVTVVAFASVTAYWSHHVGIPLRDPDGQMFRGRLISALVLLVILAVLDSAVRTKRPGWSIRGWFATLRARWTGTRLALAVSGLLAYHFVYICYRNLKSWDVLNTPRDGDLLDFERWLFFGHDPAALLHDVLGQGSAMATTLMIIYKSFTYLVPLAVVGALVFTTRIRDGYVLLASAMWVWILGVASYYLIPTLGPFASDPETFAGLPHTGITSTQAEYLAERAHLLANPGAGDSFASISAFASLHCAVTAMILLMLRYYGQRRLAQVLTVYLALVMVATIYFGWHFVVDDIAGVLLAATSVLIGRFLVYPRGRPVKADRPVEADR